MGVAGGDMADLWLSKAGASGQTGTRQKFDLFLVVDIEETCKNYGTLNPVEIIEFSAIAMETATGTIVSEFHSYVTPEINPVLTEYCIETTGITQADVDTGREWQEVVDLVD